VTQVVVATAAFNDGSCFTPPFRSHKPECGFGEEVTVSTPFTPLTRCARSAAGGRDPRRPPCVPGSLAIILAAEMKTLALAIVGLGLAAGCSTTPYLYEIAQYSPAKSMADMVECRREAASDGPDDTLQPETRRISTSSIAAWSAAATPCGRSD